MARCSRSPSTVVVLKTLSAGGHDVPPWRAGWMVGLLVVQDLAGGFRCSSFCRNWEDPEHLAWKLARGYGARSGVSGRGGASWHVSAAPAAEAGPGLGIPGAVSDHSGLPSESASDNATQSAGLSFALGAFVAGLILSDIGVQPPGPERRGPGSRHLRSAVLRHGWDVCWTRVTLSPTPAQIALAVILILLGKSVILGWPGKGVWLRQHGPLDHRPGAVPDWRVLVRAGADRSQFGCNSPRPLTTLR